MESGTAKIDISDFADYDGRYQSLSDDEFINRDGSAHSSDNRRTRSLCDFQLRDYSLGEIRTLHERLAARKPLPYRRAATARPSFTNFNSNQMWTLACICLTDFTSYCSMAILAPFFPKEASEKGMSTTMSGLLFSFYAFIIFITSPLIGKIIPKMGVKLVFTTGLFVSGCSSLAFGALEYVYSPVMFAVLCFLLDGLEALGTAAYSTASFVFVAEVFPDNVGAVLGLLEIFVGVGMSLGPALGGWLYSLGGFQLPFYAMGALMLTTVPLSMCLMTPTKEVATRKKCKTSIFQLLRSPVQIMIAPVIVIVAIIWGFIDPTLEPHLRQFSMTPEKVALVFFMFAAVYGVSSPLWGWVSDRSDCPWLLMSVGLFTSSAALLALGPAPFLVFLPVSPTVILVALAVLGSSVSLSVLPTFEAILDQAIKDGHRDDSSTYCLVAGIWASLYALGEMIGPLLGAVLTEHYGFPVCCTVVASLTVVVAAMSIVVHLTLPAAAELDNTDSDADSDSGLVPHDDSSQEDISESRALLVTSDRRKHRASEGDNF